MKGHYKYIYKLSAKNCRNGIEQERRYLAFYLAHYHATHDERDRLDIAGCFRRLNAYRQALKASGGTL